MFVMTDMEALGDYGALCRGIILNNIYVMMSIQYVSH